MKKLAYAFAALTTLSTTADGADILPGYLHNEKGLAGYMDNTLVVFDPDVFERHTWYSPDGTVVHFDAGLAADGKLTLTSREGKWRFEREQIIYSVDADGKLGAPELQGFSMNSHVPGQIWHELVPEGPRQNMRDIYTLVPGRQ